MQARDQVGLRALNDALRGAFDAPGRPASSAAAHPPTRPPRVDRSPAPSGEPSARARADSAAADAALAGALRFKQSPVRLHPGEDRGVSLVIDPRRSPPGTPVAVTADAGLRLKLWGETVPEPNRGGWSRV